MNHCHCVTIYSLLFLCNTFVSLFVGILAWQHRMVNGARALSRLMFTVGIWSFFVFFETLSSTVEGKIFWSKIAYIGAMSTPLFYLFFVIDFVGKSHLLTLRNRLLSYVIPVITLGLVFTNEYHKLIWSGFSPISQETNMMEYYHGIGYWIGGVGYNYLLFITATFFLFSHIVKRSKSRLLKIIVIFIGGLIPWVASVLYLVGLNILPGLDIVPGSIILSGILFGYFILNVRFLDLAPMARETLVENLTDGILVLDSMSHIQDINTTALSILNLSKKNILGMNLSHVSPLFFDLIKPILESEPSTMLEDSIEIESKHYSILKQEIRNHQGSSLIVIRDITRQKIVQDELEKSERRYRELAELLPEMICELDINANLLYANQFALEKFGYTHEEVWSKPFSILDVFDKRDRARVKNNMRNTVLGRGSSSNEYTVVKKNGEPFPVLVYTSAIFNKGIVIGFRGVMIDISDRKKQELQIAKNLRQQEIISQISLNYNGISDYESKTKEALQIIGEHIQASRVYIFEDSPDGLSTNNTYEWCGKDIEPQIDNLQNIPYSEIPSWKKFLQTDGIINTEDVKVLPSDIRNYLDYQSIISIVVLPLFWDGQYYGFIGFDECTNHRIWTKSEIVLLRTVSNLISNAYMRNKINIELTNSLNEISGIINSIPDLIIRISDDGRIVSYESEITQGLFTEYSRGTNDKIDSLLSSELAGSFSMAIQECLINGTFKFDFNSLRWDKMEYYEARFVKLKKSEVLAIIRNVTESKEQEKLLQIAKFKAEEASRMKSEFLANVSHEIRTPMNAILGFSEWLHDNSTDEMHKSYLHTILSSGKNLLALINDILDLSKIESGRMDLQLEPMQCKIVIQEIKQVLKQKLDAKNLAFDIDIDKSVPSHVFMDEVRFYQILFNIISNAVKFTDKGYIHVMVFATSTINERTIDLIVSIEDTGIGINEDQQETIFNAFTQQSGQSNRHYEGTGLGLSIVSGLMKKLNGEIFLKSKPGKGSTFTLKFKDVAVADVKEQKTNLANSYQNFILKSCKIMIVDDVKFNIQVLKRLINSDDVTYLEVFDGQQALDLLATETPDIIFMDIRMPVMNGYTATEIIKADERLKEIPVIAFTASTMSDEHDRIFRLFDGFLQKPVFRKDIVPVLSEFLPDKFEMKEPTNKNDNNIVVSEECKLVLPEIIDKLETDFTEEWNKIKDDLIIFDIEDFYNSLSEYANSNICPILKQYCKELNVSLQSFDIEQIKIKINEYPVLIERLKERLNA